MSGGCAGTSGDKMLSWMPICPSGDDSYIRQKDNVGVAGISRSSSSDCIAKLDVVTNVLDLCFCQSRACFDAELADVSF